SAGVTDPSASVIPETSPALSLRQAASTAAPEVAAPQEPPDPSVGGLQEPADVLLDQDQGDGAIGRQSREVLTQRLTSERFGRCPGQQAGADRLDRADTRAQL